MTLLLLSLCQFIPMVGFMVMIGYFARRFARKRNGLSIPDFKFDDFGEYLQLGVWPTLAYLLVSFAAIPLIFLAEIPMFWGIIHVAATEPQPQLPSEVLPFIFGLMALSYLLMIIVSMLMIVTASPVVLRSGMKKDFSAGFDKVFFFGFIRKVGLSYMGWMVVLWMAAAVASMIGMLAMFVGAIFVGTLATYAGYHLLWQHYELYLQRGGEEIKIHPDVLGEKVTPPLPPALPSS